VGSKALGIWKWLSASVGWQK